MTEQTKVYPARVLVNEDRRHTFWKISWPLFLWGLFTIGVILLSILDVNNTGRYLAAIYGALSSVCAAIFFSYLLSNQGAQKKKKQEYIDKLVDKFIQLFIQIFEKRFENYDPSSYSDTSASIRRLNYLMDILYDNVNAQCSEDAREDFEYIGDNYTALRDTVKSNDMEKRYFIAEDDIEYFRLYYERIINRFEALRFNIW